ncbi:GH1 family beta-glucosidase [Aestuariibacter sp. AA17]|uniref:Beta-glucosidase n=1 Tax=Fluctibacter corallii TaxID=2984329 RepID=A0ABT3A7G2_9ALTE|nr:GH1 family beta-glucosidase [Aestuariibacter sp. AA17]MCV2884514.1 GH1 family beta-glucosidase [Aestuariibacter sp. AA17]
MTHQFTLPKQSKMLQPAFTYGVATSSFQIEGAADKRLPCIWDTFCATKGKIKDASHGKTACDHVSRFKDDVKLIADLGVDAYRLSISWARVLHKDGNVNEEGMAFYIALLDELNAQGIKPFVTLYHWDLPQHIEDNGGWLNRKTAYLFADYVEKVCVHFGERVHSYATFNEPFCSAYLGYEIGIHAPGLCQRKYGRQAAHHILLAHGLGMTVLKKYSPNTLNGIVLNYTPAYPASNSEEDRRAADLADQYHNQWYTQPIFDQTYPDIINQLNDHERPHIEEGDMAIIGQPIDFLGVNFYTRATYRAAADLGFQEIAPGDEVEKTDMGWEVYPDAFTDLLIDLHKRYDLPPVYITENGAATVDVLEQGEIIDTQRIAYYQSHLNAVNDAIEAGVDIRGYFAWSLMDNFEWAEGYLKRFGIVYVNYATLARIPKLSAKLYKALITGRT